jgi:aspartokinase-like uncharacterized kinase
VSDEHGIPTRVIKLGGSLLDWPEWPPALRRWRQTQPPMRELLIVGGGGWADLVREADARFALGEESSHWLCLRLMGVTARLAHRLLPEASFIDTWLEAAAERRAPSLAIVDCLPLIEEAERHREEARLPHSWDVTSDSIAAWLAARLGAAELMLLKSQLPSAEQNRRSAAECGYVDRHFPIASKPLKIVRCVNLRDVRLPATALSD